MRARDCLFYFPDSTCKDGETSEHIIQRGLGGTLEAKGIICPSCNSLFSEVVDKDLVDLYFPLLELLAPELSAYMRRRKRKIESDCGLELVRKAGGVVSLAKVYHLPSKQLFVGPLSYSDDEISAIAQNRLNGHYTRLETINVLTRELLENGGYHEPYTVTENTFRAVAKSILEFIRYGELRLGFPEISRLESLSYLRRFVSFGTPNFQSHALYWAKLGPKLDSIFSDWKAEFSHRVVVSLDEASGTLVGVLQLLNTLPWTFVLRGFRGLKTSVSIRYQKSLVGPNYEAERVDMPLLTKRDFACWTMFSQSTLDAMSHSFLQFWNSYNKEIGRVQYYVNMKNDQFAKEFLRQDLPPWRVQSSGGRNRVSERSEQYAVLPSRRRAGA